MKHKDIPPVKCKPVTTANIQNNIIMEQRKQTDMGNKTENCLITEGGKQSEERIPGCSINTPWTYA
jgi:hypothetical protein